MKKMMKFQLTFLFIFLMLTIFFCSGYSGEASDTWEKTYGGSERDVALSIIQADDGGYAVCGFTRSKGNGNSDAWIMKLNEAGEIIWDRLFGRSLNDVANTIIQTKDGGYAVSGYTVFKSMGEADPYILKLDEEGNKAWDKIFYGNNWDCAYNLIQTTNEEYLISGYTWSKGAGKSDGWLIKLNNAGNMIWNKTFGGSENDEAHSAIQTGEGDYVIAGKTQSKGEGKWDAWIIKTDEQGNIKWEKTFGGSDDDCAYTIIETNDGGYLFSGYTKSKGAGKEDVWVTKLDIDGNMLWDKTFGGIHEDIAKSMVQVENGDYVIAGETQSIGAGKWDAWIIKIDELGNSKWVKTIGGNSWDSISSIIQTKDENYLIAGWTMSRGAGEADLWVIKFNGQGD